jgi:serine/threonine protein kinase
MAQKVIKGDARGSRSYQTERRNLDLFKKGVTDCDVILKNFASFVHGSSLNIIYPLADLDLHTFLEGNYTTFQNRADAFKPRHMLGQIRSLASALQFLHAELYIEGQMSECAHLDLKPDNILVFWRDDGGTDECAGQWKITDFGISIVRSREPGGGRTERRTDQRLAPGDIAREISSRERSFIQAPRGPGPWQPPEMQEGRVTKSSDLWSFGCILATVLAFTLGGPEKVDELYLCRRCEGQYENDYFYTDGPVVKSEVLQWLNAQVDAPPPAQRQWIKLSQDLIVELLNIDKNQRPSAQKARNRVSEILQMTESEASLWKPPRNKLSQKSSSPPVSDSESVASFGIGASQELTEKSLESGGPNPDVSLHSKPERSAHSGTLPADNTRDRRKVVSRRRRGWLSGAGGVAMTSEESTTAGTDNIAPQADTDLEPTTTRIRTSVSWPAPTEAATYARLETPPKTTQVRLSPDGQIAAFLSKARVFVYCLTDISLLQQPWPQSLNRAEMISQNSDPNSFQEFTPSNGRQWTSVLVAGPFVALCSVQRQNSNNVHVAPLNRLDWLFANRWTGKGRNPRQTRIERCTASTS